MDKSNMSEEFHDWLEQCPVTWSKKYGEATYTFWEDEHDSIKNEHAKVSFAGCARTLRTGSRTL